ncbi:MAG: cell division protein [Pedosphaera sp.]|nr:cell division protein [Pedosphaera sp.]
MTRISLRTEINAPIERVFDLARSIELHEHSTHVTNERAVGGVTSGLIGLGQEVTWRARHFGIVQHLTVKITKLDRPKHFQDVMVSGAFKSMQHDHTFREQGTGTLMIDQFDFAAPLGWLGRCAERLFLKSYMRRFLIQRNQILKGIAESEDWKQYL